MSLYAFVLLAHSYVRWAVVATALFVTVRGFVAASRGEPWEARHEALHRVLLGVTDVQFMLGLALWTLLSPISRAFFADPRHAIHDHVLRFFGIEHVTVMIVAVGVLHGSQRWTRRASTAKLRHRRVAVSGAAFLALVASSIPWPGLRHGRPLLRTELPLAMARSEARRCPPIYDSRCAMCHGSRGAADGVAAASLHPPPRNFTDATWQRATSDERIHDVVHDGGFAHGLSAAMPAQPDLSPADVGALTACIRSFAAK